MNQANFLREARRKTGLTGKDFAKRLGVDPAMLSRWELSPIALSPQSKYVPALARELNMAPEQLATQLENLRRDPGASPASLGPSVEKKSLYVGIRKEQRLFLKPEYGVYAPSSILKLPIREDLRVGDRLRVPIIFFVLMNKYYRMEEAISELEKRELEVPFSQDALGLAVSGRGLVPETLPSGTTILFPHKPIGKRILAVTVTYFGHHVYWVNATYPNGMGHVPGDVLIAGVKQGTLF